MDATETASLMLRWALLFMLKYPDVCEKVKYEIDNTIGRGRMVSMGDKINLPYTEATVMEILRVANVAPLGFSHLTTEEVEFKGYTIPSGTAVFTNLTAIMNDPKYFPESEKFLPDRYLDENGKVVINEALIPFSVGKY